MKITVVVKPNSKFDQVELADGGVYMVRTKAPATEGKANEAVVKLLAEHLGVPKTRLKIIRGLAGRQKIIEIDG